MRSALTRLLSTEKPWLRRLLAPLALLLAIPLLYPALFVAFGDRVPFAGHADLNYIWGVIAHLLKTDWAHLYELPVFQPLPGMLAYGHPLLGLYPFFKLFALLGFDLGTSHSLYLVSALYLNALGNFLLLRSLKASRAVALVLAFFTLVWGLNAVHFIWLNFLSVFWLPFCLLFLVRWHRKPSWSDGWLAALCSVMLFAACEYYGIHFYLFLLAPLLIALLAAHRSEIRRVFSLLLPFAASVPLILTIYWPLLDRGRQVQAASGFDPAHLLGAGDLFCYSHLLHGFFPAAAITGHSLYLGIGLAMLLFFFFTAWGTKIWPVWSLLLALTAAAAVLFFVSPVWLDWLTLTLLVVLCLLFLFRVNRKTDFWSRYSAWACAGFLLLLWGLPHWDPQARFSLYRLIWEHAPGFRGLRAVDRIFPLLLPLLLIMAASGLRMLAARGATRRVIHILLAVSALLMTVEHYYSNQFDHLGRLPLRTEIYRSIAKEERGSLLALPAYRDEFGEVQNARYMVNQVFHNLTLIGGRTSHTPTAYYPELHKLIDHGRLDENSLRRLIDGHALSHLAIHWDWLNEYYGAGSPLIGDIRAMTQRLDAWLQPLYQNGSESLYRVVDAQAQTVFLRTFSRGQLLGGRIQVKILGSGCEWLEWSLADGPPCRLPCAGRMDLSWKTEPVPNGRELVLKIRCPRPTRLDIRVLR